MKLSLPFLLGVAATVSTGGFSSVSAFPYYGYGGPPGPPPPYLYGRPPLFPRYGYGYRLAPYGFRRGLSYGTGYRGRGTFTGGPAGGLPSRN